MHSTLVSLGILQAYGVTLSVSVTVSVSDTLLERLLNISNNLYEQAFYCV